MRLRRETGDFQIKVTVNDGTATVNSINKLLIGEDFVGQIVDADGTFEVITKASESNLTVTAVCESYTLTYTKATGAIVANPNEDTSNDGTT